MDSSIPATSAKVTLVVPLSTRRARERPKAPSALICPPPARRASQTNSATSRITGPKPRMMFISVPRPSLIGSAEISTFSSSSSEDSASVSAKAGTSVSKLRAVSRFSPLAGKVTSRRNSPSIVVPVESIRMTLPLRTSSRKTGLYGTRTDFSRPGASSATLM